MAKRQMWHLYVLYQTSRVETDSQSLGQLWCCFKVVTNIGWLILRLCYGNGNRFEVLIMGKIEDGMVPKLCLL